MSHFTQTDQAIYRRREFARCTTRPHALRYLAGKLGYDWNPEMQQGVTDHFHGPLCDRMDRLRSHKRVATFAPRKSLKSTILTICLAVQEIMLDPDITMMVNHAVESEANSLVAEVAGLFQHNDYLRSLDPMGVYPAGHPKEGKRFNLCPSKTAKRWLAASPSARFTITSRPKMRLTTRRQPTLVAKGAGSEITGAHVDLIFLDDIIGWLTLLESTGVARIRDWFRVTVINVLNVGGRLRLVGTRYDENDFYGTEVIGKPLWDVVVRHARETDGRMDWKGKPVHWGPARKKDGTLSDKLGKRLAERRERHDLEDMGMSDYASQRMNDPTPSGSIPWVRENEKFCGLNDRPGCPGAGGPGVSFILSDPAPRASSTSDVKERDRGDGSKDYWSIAAVRFRVVGETLCCFLVDGQHSQDWDRNDGLEVSRQLMAHWQTPYFMNENYTGGQGDYSQDMRLICQAAGTPLYLEKGLLPKFSNSYANNAKKLRIEGLAAWNNVGRFYICEETVPAEFLYGDGKWTGFLTQMRKLRPLPGNRNNLRWDDDADVVSRSTDAKLQQFAPSPRAIPDWKSKANYLRAARFLAHSRVRHIRV